jgi:hypothetical protein
MRTPGEIAHCASAPSSEQPRSYATSSEIAASPALRDGAVLTHNVLLGAHRLATALTASDVAAEFAVAHDGELILDAVKQRRGERNVPRRLVGACLRGRRGRPVHERVEAPVRPRRPWPQRAGSRLWRRAAHRARVGRCGDLRLAYPSSRGVDAVWAERQRYDDGATSRAARAVGALQAGGRDLDLKAAAPAVQKSRRVDGATDPPPGAHSQRHGAVASVP